ncbi:recombinase family protein [Streptomyces yangpuensis]|uniref:recombinase family protein n=1 Tax=Streptomyces yangpuensis TaxID=1648182 RepID=UPI003653DC96
MRAVGVAEEHIYVDKRTGANMDCEGLTALLGFARPAGRINVLTLDRLGRNMRETLNLVHDLTERGVFLRTSATNSPWTPASQGPGRTWPSRSWQCSRRWNGSTCWSVLPAPVRPRRPADCRSGGRRS